MENTVARGERARGRENNAIFVAKRHWDDGPWRGCGGVLRIWVDTSAHCNSGTIFSIVPLYILSCK